MPKTIRMPDGTIVENVPDDMSKELLLYKYNTSQMGSDPANDPTGSFGENVLAGTGKAFSDIWAAAQQMAGVPGAQDTIDESRRLDEPLMGTGGGVAGNIAGNVAAFAPAAMIPGAATLPGAAIVGGAMGALQPVSGDESRADNVKLGGVLGAAGQTVGKAISGIASGRKASKEAARLANIVKDEKTMAAVDAGYVIPPTHANPSFINNTLEGFAGKISTAQKAATKNQEVTDRLARKALGVPDSMPLTPGTMKDLRGAYGRVYEQVKQLGPVQADKRYMDDIYKLREDYVELADAFPDMRNSGIEAALDSASQGKFTSKNIVNYVKQLRKNSSSNFKAFDNPEKIRLAQTQRGVADAMEDMMERNISKNKIGYTGREASTRSLIDDYKHARQQIAKIHSVEGSLNESGNVVARDLAKLKSKGVPLSGDLDTIASAAGMYPKALQEVGSSFLGNSPLDWGLSGGLALGTGNPAMLATAFARPTVRNIITSSRYQKGLGMANPSYNAGVSKFMQGLMDSQAGEAGMGLLPPAVGLFSDK